MSLMCIEVHIISLRDVSWLLMMVLIVWIYTRQVVNWKCVLQHLGTGCNHSKQPFIEGIIILV